MAGLNVTLFSVRVRTRFDDVRWSAEMPTNSAPMRKFVWSDDPQRATNFYLGSQRIARESDRQSATCTYRRWSRRRKQNPPTLISMILTE